MLVVLTCFSTWAVAQCNSVTVLNYTAVTIDLGGEAVFPIFCPPDGDPEAILDFGIPSGGMSVMAASPGKQFHRIGAMSILGTGSIIAPDWAGLPCDFAYAGPYFFTWDIGGGSGHCRLIVQ